MTVKALASLKSKLLKPCRKLFPSFKFIKLKRPVFIRPLKHRHRNNKATKPPRKRNRITALLATAFGSSRKTEEMNRLVQLKSFSDRGSGEGILFPSPLTPAYLKANRAGKRDVSGLEDVEDACRSFENYLVEMIVEEGKVRDLMDIEELLYCWRNLKCPVFVDLVSRFYGELCNDLFSTDTDGVDGSQ
ncbi:transcription repressor OFP17 [Humulus lupulus]|uniref:transcription repressor OFP17 n=1 Tax=Humulus lupulus TaxID=3486 RepID=UPI002B40DCAB|nr:transcription repressor OFP17 [Humulus lupulus]